MVRGRWAPLPREVAISQLAPPATDPNTKEDGARDRTGRRLLCAPVEEKTPQVDILGPKSRHWGGVPHCKFGMTAWTHLAALICVDPTRHRAVKQGKSRGSVGTTDQGKGKGSREGKIGQGGRGRAQGGERPMATATYGGKGTKGTAVNGDRLIGAASCR